MPKTTIMTDHTNADKDQYEILIIEDNPDNLNLLNRILKEHGYRVRPTSNGSHALKSVAARRPDLILLNIEIPGMNGYEVCHRLKADKKSRNIPIIFISGHDDIANKVQAFKAGGIDYITKPFEREEVLARIQTHLRLWELTEQLEQEVNQRTAELKVSEKRYSEIVESTDNLITEVDAQGRLIFVNKAARKVFGLSPQECIGKMVFDFIHPDDREITHQNFLQWVKDKKTNVTFENRQMSQSGKVTDMHWTINLHFDGKGYITSIKSIARDVTEQKKAEEELKKHRDRLEELVRERTAQLYVAKERAEAANEAKTAFLANISHELRTPLNAIIGYSHLMLEEILSPTEQYEYLSTITRNSEHLLALINDVLDISKIEAGQVTVEDTTFDLPALLENLEKAFGSILNDKGVSLEIIGTDSVPRYVTTDENKLRQVVVNLLDNAIKFTEQGYITIRLATRQETAGPTRLAVEVQDTGIGIGVDELDKVFGYFDQTARGRAQKRGTGLGLAISRDFVRMMGGDMTVTSEEGKGSTFRFEIDIQKGSQKDIRARGSSLRVLGLQPGQEVPRVLVAEDDTDSRNLLVSILKTAGFQVKEAINGNVAVEIFNQWQPDFIWMDIRMPMMDGLEATGCIKKTEAGQSTFVAALTAHALAEEKDKILAAGCDDFVRKPYREQEIFAVMAKHLDLEYVYENNPVEPDMGVEDNVELTPQQLATLPADLRDRLHQAAVVLDEVRSLKIIEQIGPYDADMANALKTIVNHLEFRRLLDFLQGGKAKPGDNQ